MFERYVNFEFYKRLSPLATIDLAFERYVNFEFYKRYLKLYYVTIKFERYVNFEFYKRLYHELSMEMSLRDM